MRRHCFSVFGQGVVCVFYNVNYNFILLKCLARLLPMPGVCLNLVWMVNTNYKAETTHELQKRPICVILNGNQMCVCVTVSAF